MPAYPRKIASLSVAFTAVFALAAIPAGKARAEDPAATSGARTPAVANMLQQLPLAFEPNRGQAEPEAEFVARGPGYRILLTRREAVLAFGRDKKSWLRIRPVRANSTLALVAEERLPGKSNYLDGATPSTWNTAIPNYGRVVYRNVYPGIDLAFHGKRAELEYDWILHAGADPARIRLFFAGSRAMLIEDGDLIVRTVAGELRNRKPAAYQEIAGRPRQVAAGYVLERGRQAGLRLGPYDRRSRLVIDPTLVYLKSVESLANNAAPFRFGLSLVRMAVDAPGNLYLLLTGFDNVCPDTDPQVLAKVNAAGTVIFSTQLGFLRTACSGSALGLAVDRDGSIYLAGGAASGLATTPGALQPKLRGQTNAFVAKLNPAGTALVYSTFLGGSSRDAAGWIAADAAGNAYVLGGATSADFPTTTQALGACGGSQTSTMFVAKLNAAASALVYSSCIGGTSSATASGFAIDAAGNAYAAGTTAAADLPTTPGAFQTKFAGGTCKYYPYFGPCQHGFVFKLNPSGSAFLYSTFLQGVGGGDSVKGLALDSSGNVYVTGTTSSPDFPTTPGAVQIPPGQYDRAFTAKLNPSGSGLVYSTLAGGSGIAIDAAGNAYVAGSAYGPGFPEVDPIQAGYYNAGGQCGAPRYPVSCTNVLVFKLNATGTALLYSTYLGSAPSTPSGIAVDNFGNAYVAGFTAHLPDVFGDFLLKLADAGHTPAFPGNGIVNAASFQPGVAGYGELATVFGTNLTNAQGVVTANSLPLPTQLGGSSVLANGVPMPILAVANVNGQQQINFQTPNSPAFWTFSVTNNGVRSLGASMYSRSPNTAHPGIFTTDGTRGAILHGVDFQAVTPANPAVRGEVLALYATGLGLVEPDPGPGNPASSSPLSLTKGTTYVVVAEKLADVLFSGLAPGFVGLSQVNFRVPADVPSGDVEVFLMLQANNAAVGSQKVKLAIQ